MVGLPWWLVVVLVAGGILIGHYVVPYVDDRPRLEER